MAHDIVRQPHSGNVSGVATAVRALFYSVIMLGGPGYFGYHQKPAEMGIAAGAGVGLLFFLNLHRFRKFKGGGVEAELVETVKEAQATIEHLRRLVRPLVLFSIKQLTWANRWGKMPNSRAALNEMLTLANDFGVEPDSDLERAFGDYYRLEAWDRLQQFNSHVRLKDKQTALSDALAPLHKTKSVDFPSEEAIRTITAKHGLQLSPAAEDLLREFLSFVKEHEATARRDSGDGDHDAEEDEV